MAIMDVTWPLTRMQAALLLIEEAMQQENIQPRHWDKSVFDPVQGDGHDVGKNNPVMLLKVRGFEVTDLGLNVPGGEFVVAVRKRARHPAKPIHQKYQWGRHRFIAFTLLSTFFRRSFIKVGMRNFQYKPYPQIFASERRLS